jgi:MFS family permease
MRKRAFSATSTTLLLICLMYAITYIDRVNVSTAALVFKKDLNLSNAQVGLVFSAFAYPYVLLTVMGGWMSDKLGARRALTWASMTWAAATLWTGMSFGFTSMILSRLLLGIGEGATFPIATRALCDWIPKQKRALSQGLTHSSSRLGAALTPPLVAWLIAVSTWRGSFIVLGLVSVGWALAWWFWFRDSPRDHLQVTKEELLQLDEIPAAGKVSEPIPWFPLARRMLPVTIVYFCYGWTLWLYLAWMPSYFAHNYNLNIGKSALFSAGVFLGGVLGDTAGGMASDAIFRKTKSLILARRNLVIAGFLCSLGTMLMIFFIRDAFWASLCLSMAFFAVEFTVAPMWTIPMDIAPSFAGSASGIMNTGSPLAAIISPIVFGYVIDRTGNWNLPFTGSIAILLIGSIVAFWMKPEVPFVLPARQPDLRGAV